MSDLLFGKTLDWFMSADPWPFGKAAHDIIEGILDDESKTRGFQGWIDAFHKFKV